MMKTMCVAIMTGCSFMFSSCGENEKVVDVHVGDGTELDEDSSKVSRALIEHTFDGTKSDGAKVFKITVDVYEAPALGLGESYLSVKQLEQKSARPIAKLTNLVHSGESVELIAKEDECTLRTGVFLAENGQFVDVQLELSLKEFEMSFSTLIKFNYPAFYEVNVSGQPDKVHVLVLNGFEHPKL